MAARTLKGSVRSQLWPVLLFALLTARLLSRTGFGTGRHFDAEGWLELLLAAVVLVFASLNLFKPATLILDERGFTWRSWRYSATYPWTDIDTFYVGPSALAGKPKIAFNSLPGKIASQTAATEFNRSANGFDRSMTNVWSLPSDELVDLLNGYLCRARQHRE